MKKDDDIERIKAYMKAKMKHIKMYNECMNLADGLDVEKFAELVRADEREACAKVAEEGMLLTCRDGAFYKLDRTETAEGLDKRIGRAIAEEIRARGETK